MRCSRCKKNQPDVEFEVTKRGQTSKRCKGCMEYVRRDTTCKRCLKTFPLEEFRVGRQGTRVTYCLRCSGIALESQRNLLARMRKENEQLVANGEKACLRCRATKPVADFKDEKGYIRGRCAPCREYMKNHQAGVRKAWSPERAEAQREYRTAIRRALRAEVLAAYGGACKCCGERTPEFLAVDHVNNDGAEHRKMLRQKPDPSEIRSAEIYYWLREKGYPEGFQILCHNCNIAKGLYGACPHIKPSPPVVPQMDDTLADKESAKSGDGVRAGHRVSCNRALFFRK